uniref:Reverse transcriptase domain-containing protein n=1 Tax=Nicotiana tabacum TaxID=4097 RepID=A0A1S4DMX4_TOBAC|nr:PREDICTED: uncharacterized protein LOC107831498 [Nicotiana tabacum]
MECITTVTYSLTLNEGLTKPFKGQRGIKQGDPMSPYLFVLAMKYLQREFDQLALNKEFHFHPRCKKLGVIHDYRKNADKSSIYLAGISANLKEDILQDLGYNEGTLPFKYLGVPLASTKLLQLIKSVIFGVQSYWANIFLLPKKVLNMIEATCRTFLWTSKADISRKELVSWEKICMPQAAGGLNVIYLYNWNKATMKKHLWDITKKKDFLSIRWIHAYYIKNQTIDTMSIHKNAAWVVRKILELRKLILYLPTMQRDLTSRLRKLQSTDGRFSIKKL